MPESSPPSVNSWLEDELYHQYLNDRQAVDTPWKQIFEGNGHDEPVNLATTAAEPRPALPAIAAPAVRALCRGREWSVSEYLCTAGPHDRPFEERHHGVSIAAVIEGTFTYRTDSGTAMLHPGAFL